LEDVDLTQDDVEAMFNKKPIIDNENVIKMTLIEKGDEKKT
jgi:hypothetical protein